MSKAIAYKALTIHPRLSNRARRVAIVLIDKYGRRSNPGAALAERLDMHPSDLKRALRELCEGEDRLFDREPGKRGSFYRPRWETIAKIGGASWA